jgi:hypothetical protein
MTHNNPIPPLVAALFIAAAVAGCQSTAGSGGTSAAAPVETWNSYSASRSNRGGD